MSDQYIGMDQGGDQPARFGPKNPFGLDPALFEEWASSNLATGNIAALRETISLGEVPGFGGGYSKAVDGYRSYIAQKQKGLAEYAQYVSLAKEKPGRDQTILTEHKNPDTLLGNQANPRTILG